MAAGDVARLVLQVDAATELARTKISALAAAVEGDARKMDRSLAAVDNAHARLARSSGSSRIAQMEFTHVITASTDAINAGIPVSRVFAMEIGRIAQAASYAAGDSGAGGFAKFISGPYGIALQIGVGMLTMLAMRHQGAADGAAAHRDKEKDLADVIKEVSDATRTLNDNELVTIQRHLDAARAAGQRAMAERGLTKALLEGAIAHQQKEITTDSPEGGPAALAGQVIAGKMEGRGQIEAAVKAGKISREDADRLSGQAGNIGALTAELARVDQEIAMNERSLASIEVDFAKTIARAQTNRERMVDFQFNQKEILLQQDFRRRTAGRDPTAADRNWMVEQENKLATAREAAMRTAQAAAEAERRLSDTRASGRHITTAEAESIVRSIGGQVNSGFRSHARQQELYDAWVAQGRPADNPVAKPGTSGHERGTSLDVQMRPGLSLGRIVEAFRSEGVAASGFPERGHYHINFAGPQGPSQETLDHRAQAAANAKRHDQESFGSAQSSANQRLAAAEEEAAKNSENSLDLQIERIQKERESLDEATRRTATEHHWTAAETNVVLELNRRWAQQKISTAIVRDEAANSRDQLDIARAGIRNEQELTRARADLADTAKQRRASAIALLDLSQQQERLELEALLASKEATGAQKQIARARLDMLPQLRDLGVQAIDRQTEGSGARFSRELAGRLGDVNEQLDQVKVRGLQSLEDELAGVISGTESVSSAFKRMAQSIIADLARIAIEKEIIQPLANMLFGGTGGGGGDFLSALGSATGSMQGFAAGGDPPIGRVSLVGERGPELIVPRSPVTVIPNHMIGRGGGGGVTFNQQIHIDAQGAEIGVEHKIAAAMAAHAPAIAAGAARQVVRLLTRPGLN